MRSSVKANQVCLEGGGATIIIIIILIIPSQLQYITGWMTWRLSLVPTHLH